MTSNADMLAIRKQGYKILVDGLGGSGAVNFLRQIENGSGDYTSEREKMQEDVTIDEIVARIKKRKGSA